MKKILSILISISIIFTVLPAHMVFATTVSSGTCGTNATWTLDSEGTLTISGSGVMGNYWYNSPWYSYNNQITNIVVNDGITSIGSAAFQDCKYVTSIKLPESVETIGSSAFYLCTSLTEINIPRKVTIIDQNTFYYCCNLEKIIIPNNIKEIRLAAFNGCSLLEEIILPESVVSVENGAFSNCLNLKSITIPNSLTSIGNTTFDGCTSLENFVISDTHPTLSVIDGVLYKEKTTLMKCPAVKTGEFTIPDYVEEIGVGAFYASKLDTIIIPSSVTTIFGNAFRNSSISSIELPESITSIGGYAFANSKLEKIVIPDSVDQIVEGVFENCSSLAFVALSNNIKSISSYAFRNSGIKKISIPSSITNMYYRSFYECVDLETIYYGGSQEQWETVSKSTSGLSDSIEIVTDCETTQIETFSLSTNDLSIVVGYSDNVSVNIMPKQCEMKKLNWTSSDGDVAIVDSWGYITGMSEGVAVIMAEDESGNYMDACIVEVVNPILVNEIKLSESDISIVEGENKTITSTIEPANATNTNVIWTSSDENIATVENGVVTAISEGEVTITVTSEDGNASSSCSVTVEKLYPLTGIKFDATKITLNAGDSHSMNVTYTPENATYKNLVWTSSEPAVATVENGVIKALSAGTAIVVATSEDGGYKATCIVTVIQPVKVIGISLDKNSLSLIKGESIVVNATVSPTDATNKNIIWTSSDTDVAKVENGEIFAIAEGTTTVTATTEDGGYTAACKITVLPIPVTGVVLDKSSLSIVLGESGKLTATISPDNAANKSVKWSSNNENIVSVDNGTIKALSIGTAIITVTTEVGGFTDSCEVTVLPVSVTGIRVDRSELNIIEGTTETITATILPENATDKTVLWSSNDEKVATVENGLVTGVGVGTTVIVAKTKDGNYSEYCVVTVSATHVPVSSITLNTNTMSLVEGYSESLTATINPGNATNKNIVWTSNNETVATVVDGNVTALTPGTAVIIATSEDGGYIATCIVTVSSAMQETVSAPIASVLSGVVKENTSVILLTTTRNADIYYTIDGSAPSTRSIKYTSPISITADSKIKAIAIKAGMQDSNISTFTYSLANPDIPYVNVVTNVTGVKGDITTVSVNTTENAGMAGGSFNLIYDNTAVELLSVNSGTIIDSANPIINDSYADNKIRVIWAGTREINTGGEIVSAQFRILDSDKEATYFNLEKVKMADGDSNKITTQSSDGILTLQAATATIGQEYSTQSTINSDKKTVAVNVTANSNQNAYLFVATYDDKGELIQLKKTDITNVNSTHTVEIDKTISATDEVKVFIWSSLTTLKPLSTVEIVSR